MTERMGNVGGRGPPAVWLALATGLLVVSNGRWIVPLATWLAPAALLVFLDQVRRWPAVFAALVLYVLVQFVAWWGLIPAPGVLYLLIAGTYGVVYFLPFVAHRFLASRIIGATSTLVFPLAWVSVEFLFHRWGTPYGSWFSLAYTQAGTPTLLQLASVTGTAGISFLITWFASVAAWAIQTGGAMPDWSTTKRLGVTYAAVLLTVLGAGQVRLAGAQIQLPVRTAGLVPDAGLMRDLETALRPVRRGQSLSPAAMDSLGVLAARLNGDLFARTRREALAGAHLVAWSETAGRLLAPDEARFLEHASQIAVEHGVHLMLAYGVWDPDAKKPLDNKLVAVDARGSVRWHYRKAHPIVGAESPFTPAGDGVVRSVETPDGRVGGVICHDLDFPELLRQAADSGIGLIVGPSADWRDITSLHADMAILRAIEGGFSLLRPTSGGRSIAVDTRGRTVATIDYPEDAFVAYLSLRRSPTIYGAVGDLFSWICVIGFLSLVVIGLRVTGTTRLTRDPSGPTQKRHR